MQDKIKNYAGRSSLPAIDILDLYKREVIKKIFDNRSKIEFASSDERVAVLRFRTERVTLERALELLDQVMADSLKNFKLTMRQKINLLGGEMVGINTHYKNAIKEMNDSQLNYISADSMVSLMERMSLLSGKDLMTEMPKEQMLIGE